MKKGDVIRQKCVNNTFYLTGIWAHKVNNIAYGLVFPKNLPKVLKILQLTHASSLIIHMI